MSGKCIVCGADSAMFGFRWPGPRSDIPKGKNGYIWACADHREEGERRMRAAIDRHFGRTLKDQPTTTNNKQKGSDL